MAADMVARSGLVIVLIILLVVLVGSLGGWSGFSVWPFNCIAGSGNVISETRSVGEFHSAEMRGSGNLFVTQDGTGDISIEGEDNILPIMKTYVSDGTLIIEQEPLRCVVNSKPVNVYVRMEDVKKLSVSGSGSIVSENKIESVDLEVSVAGSGDINIDVDADKLSTIISGSGEALLKGSATEHIVRISGSGDVQAFGLATTKSDISIFGSGESEVSVSSTLDVIISGSGDVAYKGSPANVNQIITGSGKLRKVE